MARWRGHLMVVLATALVVGTVVPASAGIVLVQSFEHDTWDEDPEIPLTEAIEALREAHPYLVDVRGLDMDRTRRVRGFAGHGLEVEIPPGGFRGFGPYARLPQMVDEAWFRYKVFLVDFRPVSSGKLPGLADASLTTSAKGCKPSTPEDPGWSGRLMFDTQGAHGAGPGEVPIGLYLYHLDQPADCGEEMMFDVALRQRRWTCLEGHVRMNTPGQNDGLVQVWVDGRRVLQRDGLAFRRVGEEVAIREMWNNVYFGGRYATPNRLNLVIDEIAVSDTGRPGCIDPFVDDNESIHQAAFTELHARRLFYGCAERMACPTDLLTRAEFAAMFHRLLGPPPGPDAFVDDDGHWGEASLNSLAAVGVIKGCNPPRNDHACPDAEITRAEVAAIVRRSLALPPGPAVFADVEGHWAADDIHAIAAAGITRGCDEAGYCPERPMLRQEAATFVLRSDDWLRALHILSPLPDWPPPGPPPPKPADERE